MMLTLVWKPHGFHSIHVLPKGSKFNSGHDISHILSQLQEILAPDQDDPRRHFVIHADKARPHCATMVTLFLDRNCRGRAPHPLHLPDLGLRRLAFRASQRSVSKEFSWRIGWTLVHYPGNCEGSLSWDFECGISRMDDPMVKLYWWKWWICWVMFKLKCSIPFSKR
jgi:hypothetical protein